MKITLSLNVIKVCSILCVFYMLLRYHGGGMDTEIRVSTESQSWKRTLSLSLSVLPQSIYRGRWEEDSISKKKRKNNEEQIMIQDNPLT